MPGQVRCCHGVFSAYLFGSSFKNSVLVTSVMHRMHFKVNKLQQLGSKQVAVGTWHLVKTGQT